MSKHGGTHLTPSGRTTRTFSWGGESHPHVREFRTLARDGLSCAPADCPEIMNRWFA